MGAKLPAVFIRHHLSNLWARPPPAGARTAARAPWALRAWTVLAYLVMTFSPHAPRLPCPSPQFPSPALPSPAMGAIFCIGKAWNRHGQRRGNLTQFQGTVVQPNKKGTCSVPTIPSTGTGPPPVPCLIPLSSSSCSSPSQHPQATTSTLSA